MGGLGVPELLIIGVIALLIFGPKKLPELGSGLGKAIKDFKAAISEPEPPAKPEAQAKEEKKDEKSEPKKEEETTKTA